MTDEELVGKYSKLCTHIAWSFITKNRQYQRQAHSEQPQPCLSALDAEDFAADALIKLLRCPRQYRGQHSYVLRLIINAVINSHKKRFRTLSRESLQESYDENNPAIACDEFQNYKFSEIDASRLDFGALSGPEMMVLRLHFGLGGTDGLSEKEIAKKLGRTQWWVRTRLERAIQILRSRTVKDT